MSLNIYLKTETRIKTIGSGIFIRENGQTLEISQADWDLKFPGKEPIIVKQEPTTNYVFGYNITHNLTSMAEAAGIYQHLWCPEELGITTASQLVEPLEEGLSKLLDNPDFYKKYNPPNGWGTYEGLLQCVAAYLAACTTYPTAIISVSR